MLNKGEPIWILEENVFDKEEDNRLIAAITDANQISYTVNKDLRIIAVNGEECPNKKYCFTDRSLVTSRYRDYPFIFRGSIRGCNKAASLLKYQTPTLFHDGYNFTEFQYIYWASRIRRNNLLHYSFEIRPLSMLKSLFCFFQCQPEVRWWLKPNKCGLLPGQLYNFNAIEDLVNNSGLPPDELFIVDTKRQLMNEYRVLIVNNTPVSASQYYDENGKINIIRSSDIFECKEVEELVYTTIEDLSKNGFINTYIMDIAKINDGVDGSYKILEINSFNAAALYDLNMDYVVNTISDEAIKQWREFYE